MKRLILATALSAASLNIIAYASDKTPDSWDCAGYSLTAISSDKIRVKATANTVKGTGTISVDGQMYEGEYQSQGLTRIWHIWHKEPTIHDFFIITPDYYGKLFTKIRSEDFQKGSKKKPTLVAVCKQDQ